MKKIVNISLITLLIFLVLGFYFSQNRLDIAVTFPEKHDHLYNEDFTFEYSNLLLYVGKSNSNDVIELFPNGSYLGMSLIYKPENIDCYFNFFKDSDILYKIDINSPDVKTYRNIGIGDSYDRTVKVYGENYTLVKERNNSSNYELIYGENRYIVFKFKDNKVRKVIIKQEYF